MPFEQSNMNKAVLRSKKHRKFKRGGTNSVTHTGIMPKSPRYGFSRGMLDLAVGTEVDWLGLYILCM